MTSTWLILGKMKGRKNSHKHETLDESLPPSHGFHPDGSLALPSQLPSEAVNLDTCIVPEEASPVAAGDRHAREHHRERSILSPYPGNEQAMIFEDFENARQKFSELMASDAQQNLPGAKLLDRPAQFKKAY